MRKRTFTREPANLARLMRALAQPLESPVNARWPASGLPVPLARVPLYLPCVKSAPTSRHGPSSTLISTTPPS